MTPAFFAALAADSAVVSLLQDGAILKVFRDVVPQRPDGQPWTPPYAKWSIAGGLPENYLGEPPGIDYSRVQFDVFAATAAEADAVYIAMRDVLELLGHVVAFNGSGLDDETKRYRVSWDVSFVSNR